ncbi:putative LacI family transcriptional regulator [Candidatus Rhodobacter oscarellae]|uniref:Putative LacI family transcriptional regulator n=1 Tax=Candidatus Rhodobacter oscarellae TaxID=1675527 RepID=A0A0J9EF41_9RHOB|nr:LacI family DNA-binding transcriptional regulator [Candidatus Rhodobacter lobularis]KMW60299.1 putative LacI family transcriptional regulator [Candidatus Rhodobacter lobularis]
MAKRPTQKTIAKLTGLAVATVSRALADAPDIGEETKRKVRQVAAEIGYRPDRAGVRLRTGKTNVISLVMSTDHDMMNHTARLISSMAGELRDSPYHLIVTPYFSYEDPMDAIRYIVETRSADAVIFNQTTPKDPRVAYLLKQNFPFATHGRTDWSDEHAYFDFDNTRFAEIAVHELAKRGRSQLLCVLPPMNQNYAQHLWEGAGKAAIESGISVHRLLSASNDDPRDKLASALSAELALQPKLDGIITAAPNAAMLAATAVEARGLVIGQDIDIVGKEAVPFLTHFRKNILTVREDVARAGRFLANAAMQQAAEPSEPPMQSLDVPKGFT